MAEKFDRAGGGRTSVRPGSAVSFWVVIGVAVAVVVASFWYTIAVFAPPLIAAVRDAFF
ncbi:hypothetical protein ACFRAU_16795 [Arthrobacter sp. NPDC056691]|uniref:hypothetical protein n=1 Tax=Arthrobacter sp. NPDC056691 TaxID=3345913 RepID=UPI00366C17E2